jgi:hypothetical protein
MKVAAIAPGENNDALARKNGQCHRFIMQAVLVGSPDSVSAGFKKINQIVSKAEKGAVKSG